MTLRLQDGNRVCIIGGGPAGSFAAMHLLAGAARQGLRLEVLIFEPHSAQGPGPKSCKGCAGILSDGAVRNMAGLGLTIPPEVIQSELHAYVVHVAGQVTSIVQPDPRRHILSVYRGAGPRVLHGAPPAGFDSWLLGQACARGATQIPARVRHVEWEEGPVVYCDDATFKADLVVLATGVNSRPPLSDAFHYRSPATIQMAQDEIPRPDSWPPDKVAGFFDQPAGLIFGAIVPKGPYLNVSLMWRGNPTEAVLQFFEAQREALKRFYVDDMPASLCGCNPRILRLPAPVYYGDRWVAVGDAVVARLYKDGINSACLTSRRAMQAALGQGVDGESFRASYEPLCQDIAADNRYGTFMYQVCSHTMQSPIFANACVGCVRTEKTARSEQRVFSRLMWGMLTGDESYRQLFQLLLRPRGLLGLGREMLRSAARFPMAGAQEI